MIDINHKVLIQGEFILAVAKEFRITQSAVSNAVRRLKDDPDLLSKHLRKREEKEEEKQAVMRTVNLMQSQRRLVESAQQVTELTEELT